MLNKEKYIKNELIILYVSPTGTFTPIARQNLFANYLVDAFAITSGDFNNDGKKDIAVSGQGWSNDYSVNVLSGKYCYQRSLHWRPWPGQYVQHIPQQYRRL